MKDDDLDPTIQDDSSRGPVAGSPDESSRFVENYRLLQKIGEGGMGEVYEAEQLKPIRRRVAVKIIKRGMDTDAVVARFESERQALAMMDHTCIAKVFDAGATRRGRPYFAMEFVPGAPITKHCDRARLGTRERLELFIKVCEGVQHAHQKAIIHRDIKPSNVLVTIQDDEAVPKIIDFGVAKATAQRLTERTMYTEMGQLIGTPEYMSPEQAEMTGQNIDTRTDVYSLGMLLYVLLVGALPFDSKELREGSYDDIRRKIRDDEPARPSTRLSQLGEGSTVSAENRGIELPVLRSELRGDLDWIVMKALEKDRTRRYGSPSELAADVQRFLRDEPVLATPPSAIYRTRKFVRRHRLAVASAATLLLLLLAFAVTMTLQAARIARERDRANQEAETAHRVSEFVVGLFEVSDPSEALGNSITAREILDEGAVKIRSELRDQPRVKARMMETMGRVYRSLGLYGRARPLLEEALDTMRAELGEDSPEIAGGLQNMATLLLHTGDYDGARELYEQALSIREAALGPESSQVADVLNGLGALAWRTGDAGRAQELYERALVMRENSLGPEHVEVAQSLNNLAILFARGKDYERAKDYYERALAIKEKSLGPEHPDVAQSLNGLALLLRWTGEPEEARRHYERALNIREKVYGPEHPQVAQILNNLAVLLETTGDLDGARALHERALSIRETALGADHSDVAQSLTNLGNLLKAGGDYRGARPLYERALSIRKTALTPDHPKVVVTTYNLATLSALEGRAEEAVALLQEAVRNGFANKVIFDDPDLSSLRGIADFETLVAEVRSRLDAD